MKMKNDRLPGKNTKLLGGITPLYHLILKELLLVEGISEVYVFCSLPELPDLPRGIGYLQRSPELDSPLTSINEVMESFATQIEADAYLMAHATAPFLSKKSLGQIVDAVKTGGHDSALSVTKVQEFLWKDGAPNNYDPSNIPRTQDLPALFVETTGAYAYTSAVLSQGSRIGKNPKLVHVSKIEAVDVNDRNDWEVADALFRLRGFRQEGSAGLPSPRGEAR